jgi:hypothetical protein
MAAMRLVEIVLSRPSANGAQAVEQDRSDEAPRKCIALPLLKICSNFCSASKAANAETDQHGQPDRIPVQADGELKIDAIADGLRSRSLALVGVSTLVRREQIQKRKRNR